jgi:pimeloyl-ACP methyl ester carboxylesterase
MLILEDEFAKRGYLVANLDATDSFNESETSPEGITFTGHYNDLYDTIKWARKQEWFQKPFALAGQSLGAMSVLLYAEEHPAEVNLLLPISFAYLDYKSMKEQDIERFGPSHWEEWKQRGYRDKASGNPLRVPFRYAEDFEQYDFAKKADKVTARTVLIIGDLESPIRLDNNKKLFDLLQCEKELIILPGVTHYVAESASSAEKFRTALISVF